MKQERIDEINSMDNVLDWINALDEIDDDEFYWLTEVWPVVRIQIMQATGI